MSNLGNRSLTLHRTGDRIRAIQKQDPAFNYKDNWKLKSIIDDMIKTLEKLKTIGVDNA